MNYQIKKKKHNLAYNKIFFYNIFISILLLFIIELLSGSLIFKSIPCYYLECNREIKTEINKDDIYFSLNYKLDEYGFRGRSKNLTDIDILFVGGSTTREMFLNDEETYVELIEKYFKQNNKNLDFINAGKDGQSTYGHIWNFRNWFNKINKLKTKYIIYYIGLNEIILADEKHLQNSLSRFIKSNNGYVSRLFNYFYNKFFFKKEFVYNFTKKKFTKNVKKITFDENIKNNFLKKLKTLSQLTIENGAIPIFINQKSKRWYIKDNIVFNIEEGQTNWYMQEKFYATLIMNFCKKNNFFCIDLYNELELNENDFFDYIHTNAKGSKKIAKFIYSKLNHLF